MGLWDAIKTQLLDVVEWKDMDDNTIFYKWTNIELKKGSRLILRPAQDAIFLYQGRIEGIFTEEGQYDIESQIIPFLSTLFGFKFGFNSGLRAEVLFINTRSNGARRIRSICRSRVSRAACRFVRTVSIPARSRTTTS